MSTDCQVSLHDEKNNEPVSLASRMGTTVRYVDRLASQSGHLARTFSRDSRLIRKVDKCHRRIPAGQGLGGTQGF